MQRNLEDDSLYSSLPVFFINEFILWHLRNIRVHFDGDLECALILGEIAHFNLKKIISQKQWSTDELEQLVASAKKLSRYSDVPELGNLIRPTNALSISASTGIPRETVRRKIKGLIRRGWIEKDSKGNLSVTTLPAKEFRQYNTEMLDEFINTAERLKVFLQKMPG
ncbi:MAG: hypothetical protein KGZ88_23395 [Methylomicrobium sp.]|nr:hypothetical protein [Methylomicrobium sp.]